MRDFDDDVLREPFSRELSLFGGLMGWLIDWALGGEEVEGASGHPCGGVREGAWASRLHVHRS